MTNFKPMHDRVLVRREEQLESKTESGLFLAGVPEETTCKGEVMAIGGGKPLSDGSIRWIELSVGDKVLFSKYSGVQQAFAEDKNLVILKEDEILGVLS